MLLSLVMMIISLMHTMSIWWRDVLMCQWIANDDATYQWCSNRDIGDVTLACDDDNQFKAHNVKMIKGCIDDVAMCQGCASVLMVWKWSAPMMYRSANDVKITVSNYEPVCQVCAKDATMMILIMCQLCINDLPMMYQCANDVSRVCQRCASVPMMCQWTNDVQMMYLWRYSETMMCQWRYSLANGVPVCQWCASMPMMYKWCANVQRMYQCGHVHTPEGNNVDCCPVPNGNCCPRPHLFSK